MGWVGSGEDLELPARLGDDHLGANLMKSLPELSSL